VRIPNRARALLALPVAALLAACGSSGSSDGGNPQPPVTSSAVWVVPDSAAALTAAQRAAFLAGALYYNAHTAANPSGEIRGQLDKPGTVKLATLDGAQETPAVTTTAFGAGMLSVEESTGKVSGFIVTSGLVSPTAAHVHIGARGAPGAVIVPLSGGPDVWVVPDGAAVLSAAQIAAFAANELYFNAHTAANPNGEIRGQIDKAGTTRFATLSGSQETPAVTTNAFGGGVLAVDAATGKAGGFILTSGLTGADAAHVHTGVRGAPGPVIVPLAGGPNLWVVPDGAGALTAEQRAAFVADGLYYNAHTAANPNGEIRGQLDKTGTPRIAALDGAQETPAVTTTAFGAGVFSVDDTSGELGGLVATSGLVSPTAAHVHGAARGAPGAILVPLNGP
jgi:CHRD domain